MISAGTSVWNLLELRQANEFQIEIRAELRDKAKAFWVQAVA
jgi:hypothetical protein